jgi:hypothetical protein
MNAVVEGDVAGAIVGAAVTTGAGVEAGAGVGVAPVEVICVTLVAVSEVLSDPVPTALTVSPTYGLAPVNTVDEFVQMLM